MEIRLRKTGGTDVEFEGDELARVSSRKSEDQTRWTELALYRTKSGRYVVQNIGRSVVAGELDRSGFEVFDSPRLLPTFLSQTSKETGSFYLSNLAKDLIEKVEKLYPEFQGVLVEKI